ncbi:MAG: primosomal protein N' [Tenericutes bacterium]|nr:primosomal protein N' [Mycoplasmatota bacterium]
MLASVLIQYSVKSLNKVFDYIVPDELKDIIRVGHKVIVSFGNSEVEGFVLKLHNNKEKNVNYKSVIKIQESDFYLNDELLELGKSLSNSLLCNLISCYQVMLPKALKASYKTNINRKYETIISLNKETDIDKYVLEHKRSKKEIEIIELLKKNDINKKKINSSSLKNLILNNVVLENKIEVNREVSFLDEKAKDIKLTDFQESAVNEILLSNDNRFLLYGVTGSGKTEVYIELLKRTISNGKTGIVLVPEISLTPQIVSRFKSVFGNSVAVFHSSLSEGEKYDEYRRIMNHEVSLVVGARSAIFVPLNNIGLIIVDECQSTTYKQENTPKYNAIDVAFLRGEYNNAKVVLGSATPSLEQYIRAKKNVYHLVNLNKRISGKFPSIEIVDMEKESHKHNYIISDKLDKEIKNCISRDEQVILLLNRRGFSTFLSCTNCGYVYKCPNCDISLIYHKSSNSYSCHYCGYRVVKSDICPKCHEDAIRDLGLGTEKLEEMISKKYNVLVLRMDADTTSTKNSHQKLISEFGSGKYNILVGTQMISKGLNFENVSLVGVINSDSALLMPDFRSSERAYELLSQTAGRVGRFNLPGKVIIQTYNPTNYVYTAVTKNDYEYFFNYEMNIRKQLMYPPYYYICNLTMISDSFEKSRDTANTIKKYLDSNLDSSYIVLGPSVASIVKLKNKYRFNIMIKYKKNDLLMKVLKEINENNYGSVTIDINVNI